MNTSTLLKELYNKVPKWLKIGIVVISFVTLLCGSVYGFKRWYDGGVIQDIELKNKIEIINKEMNAADSGLKDILNKHIEDKEQERKEIIKSINDVKVEISAVKVEIANNNGKIQAFTEEMNRLYKIFDRALNKTAMLNDDKTTPIY
jgi:peptidoglycan hydrolase CwlO-like protein